MFSLCNCTSLRMPEISPSIRILLFVPNIIGYIRLLLLAVAYFYWNNPTTFIPLYVASMTLDFFDGIAARKLNQCSSFGAWFDVIIDNVSRGMLWANLFQWGWLMVSLEWITFVGNHSYGGSKWRELSTIIKKTKIEQDLTTPPYFVQKVMENGFKTPTGFFTIGGLHLLPLWIYGSQTQYWSSLFIPWILQLLISIVLIGGRLLSGACELWCVQKHIRLLLLEDLMDESNHNVK